MRYFYIKDGAVFIPEAINPDLVKLAKAIIKTCRLSFKAQMKTNALQNAIRACKRDAMLDALQKCIAKNKTMYNKDMALTGVTVGEVEDTFFDDKDDAFLQNQLSILVDFALINTVIEARMMPLLSAACEKTLNKKLDRILFFTNQTEILNPEDEDEEAPADGAPADTAESADAETADAAE
ncbi:MAG: hypothetical protein IJK02_06470 [Clostridia bacterium]|nr:hypothetical protein [Clostridia bacterium]